MNAPFGWLTDDEAQALRRLASHRVVLEMGAWKGRSTVVLAETATIVISVDRHQGIPEIGQSGEEGLRVYLAAVRPLANVVIVIAEFAQIVPYICDAELVFVDGSHDADSVEQDTRLALNALPDVVAFHDWDLASVREGVGRVLGESPDEVVGSLAVFGR